MIVWVTGARGFIGQHVCRHFISLGWLVHGIGHGHWPESAKLTGIQSWLNADVSFRNLHSLYLQVGKPDLIVHLAGGSSVGVSIANPREDFQRTVVSTAEVLEWIRLEAPSTTLLALSSAAVYGSGHAGPIVETAPTQPASPYGYHKLMLEELCRSYASSYGLRCVLLRPFSVYGPGLRKQLLWDICQRLASSSERLNLGGTGKEQRDWVHVEDLLQAMQLVLPVASQDVPVFNVGTGIGVPIRQNARLVIEAFVGDATKCQLTFDGQARPGDPSCLIADCTRLRVLGFEPKRSLRKGIAEYVSWFRCQQNGGRL